MFSKINSAVCAGIEGKMIRVETDIRGGLPAMNIVGLASTTVMEARERIRAAVINSGYEYPRGRVTVNLTPADLRKDGSSIDLPIAIGLLAASLYVDPAKAEKYGMIGELSLDGDVLGVKGVLPMLLGMKRNGIRSCIIPLANYREASVVTDMEIIPLEDLEDCVDVINCDDPEYKKAFIRYAEEKTPGIRKISNPMGLDFADIRGQENAKRAISIAVTGRHGLLMIGSPGCGKTMLAKRIPTIMPEMNDDEIIETAIVYSVTGRNNKEGTILVDRPFRSPHNSIGRAGLLGGGMIPIPGEITLAHNGVLFLDEVCEFDRDTIEAMRLPIEEKQITHFRGGRQYTFPCDFQLIMAANPCRCGYFGDSGKMCTCSQSQLEQYRRKLSGPMMDRVDIRVSMERVDYDSISNSKDRGRSSEELRRDVARGTAFALSMGRNVCNGNMSDNDIVKYCRLDPQEEQLMKSAYSSLKLSPRSYKKILKVARTIADMDESEMIRREHIAEALSYRMLNEVNNS